MNVSARTLFRIFLVVAFIASLYGGMSLLTAIMFVKGHILIGLVSGLVLSGMTACALGLAGLAWSMSRMGGEDDQLGLAGQPA